MTNHIKICSTCIPYLFEFWANPFVHLLLLKSSMDNVQSVLRCAIVSNVLSLYVGQCTDDDNFWCILTSIRWSRISNTKISSHFGKILFPANAITLSGRLDILSNFWLFKMWPFKQIALHKSVLTHLNLAHLSTSNFLRIWGWETWSRRKVRTHRLGRSRVWFLAPKTRWLIFHIYLFKNCADVAQLPMTCFEPGLSGVWIDLSVKGHNPYSSVIRVLFRL